MLLLHRIVLVMDVSVIILTRLLLMHELSFVYHDIQSIKQLFIGHELLGLFVFRML